MASNTSSLEFALELFWSLNGSDLVDYMETLLSDPSASVANTALVQLASDVACADEFHAVYALEFGMERAPELFAPVAARSLSDERQSVRLAAHRGMLHLPAALLTPELIANCQRAVGRFDDVRDIVDRLRDRLRSL